MSQKTLLTVFRDFPNFASIRGPNFSDNFCAGSSKKYIPINNINA